MSDKLKLPQEYVLDWHGPIGRTEPLHSLLRDFIKDFELGQNTWRHLDRHENPEIFVELDKLVENCPETILFLCWW